MVSDYSCTFKQPHTVCQMWLIILLCVITRIYFFFGITVATFLNVTIKKHTQIEIQTIQ